MTGKVWTPRPDQERVLEWLLGRLRAAVFAPTGSGKTVMAATWLHEWVFDRLGVGKTLIVTPGRVIESWLAQFVQWRHLAGLRELAEVIPFDALGLRRGRRNGKPGPLEFVDKRSTKKRLMATPGQVHLCSWETFVWLEEALGASWPYDALILDESTFAKDRASARGRAARRAVHRSGRVSHLLLLTATPNSNHDEAMFAQLDLVERGCLGTGLQNFRDTYCVPASKNWQTGQVYSWKLSEAKRPEFEAVVARLSVSVPESLGIEVLEVEQWVDLPDGAMAQYKTMDEDNVLDDVTAASESVVYGKLRQLASGFVYTDDGEARWVHRAKLDRLAALLEEIPGQVLVAYNWDEEGAEVKAMLGDQAQDIRQRGAKQAFIDGKVRALLVHPQSAAHGVDGLQAVANNVVWTSPTPDLELYDQLNGRLKRGGQEAPTVFVHVLLARGTKDARIWGEVLPTKRARAARVLEAARK